MLGVQRRIANYSSAAGAAAEGRLTAPTRIALDALPLQVRSAGVAVYVAELASALAARCPQSAFSLFGVAGRPADGAWPANVSWRRSLAYPLVMGVPPGVPRLLPLESVYGGVDLFHATAYAVPRTWHVPVVLTVHDLTLLRHPELGTAALCRSVRRSAADAPRARLVIADSQATQRDLVELCDVPESRIRVVPLGVATDFVRQPAEVARAEVRTRFGLSEPYLLHVGTHEPRKNLPRLIAAYARLRAGNAAPPQLVLAGAPGWGAAAIDDAIARSGVAARIARLGRVAPAALPALYAAAEAFVFPSLYEGFGLPLLEAMACGTPVIASGTAALAEVAGDAALLVDPADVEGLAAAMARLLDDPALRHRLADAGARRAAGYTWEHTARRTLAVYDEVLGRRLK
ncbi:MAG: glycosyltransferase family 1 protein [bacterium]